MEYICFILNKKMPVEEIAKINLECLKLIKANMPPDATADELIVEARKLSAFVLRG